MITRSMDWLQQHDHLIFRWLNRKISNKTVDSMLALVTHMGCYLYHCADTFDSVLHPSRGIRWGGRALLRFPQLPDYGPHQKEDAAHQALSGTGKGAVRKPMKDHSFPSGHSTAIFFHYHAVSVHNAVAVIALDPAGSYGQPVTHLSWLSLSFGLFGRLFRRNDLGALIVLS